MKNPQQLIQEEVDKIEDLQTRIVELRQRVRNNFRFFRVVSSSTTQKAVLAAKKAPFPKSSSSRFQPQKPASPLPIPPTEEQQEHSFWNTPGPAERTVNFKGGFLLDESVNLGDISTSSFGTPLPANGTLDFDDSPITHPRFTAKDDGSGDEPDVTPPSPLDDKAPTGSKEVKVDATPQRVPERDRASTPKGISGPQTPSRRPKIHITIETETVVVSTPH